MYDSLFELVCQLEDDGCVSSTVEAVALLKDPSYAAVLQHLGIEIKGTWNKSKMSALFDQLQAALDQDIDDGGKGTGGGGKQGGEGKGKGKGEGDGKGDGKGEGDGGEGNGKGIAGGGKGIAGSSGDGDKGIGGKGTDGGGKPGDGTGIATPADTPAPKRAKKDPDRLLETLFFFEKFVYQISIESSESRFSNDRFNPIFELIESTQE